ncbi:MAG: hypothetical protein KAH11_03500 [Rhodospirillales bacterium]|nr:hypothetical protein [Rhodospirillales bacterium]
MLAASQSDAEPGPSRHDLQRYLVMGYPVSIPEGYRWWFEAATRKAPQKKLWVVDTGTNQIGVEAVYPEMRMTFEADHDVKKPKQSGVGVIHIRIDPVPGYGKSYAAEMMRREVHAGRCMAKSVGDTCPDFSGLSKSSKEMIYLGADYNFARCTIDDGRSPNPQCATEFMLIDDIALDVDFDRRLLMHEQDIREKVFGLVCSWFEWPRGKGADPAGRPLTIDHCR